jgi:hypothetical protein
MLRLDMYFWAEALRDAGVLEGADNVLCGNCLVAQSADNQWKCDNSRKESLSYQGRLMQTETKTAMRATPYSTFICRRDTELRTIMMREDLERTVSIGTDYCQYSKAYLSPAFAQSTICCRRLLRTIEPGKLRIPPL